MNCPTCDYPMVWSDDHMRVWCSIYGDHKRTPTHLVIEACDYSQKPNAIHMRHLRAVS